MPKYTDRFLTTAYVPGGAGGTPLTYTVTSDQSGTIFITSGNMAHLDFYLPPLEEGLEYTFVCGKGSMGVAGIRVHAQLGVDNIYWPNTSAGYDYVSLSGWWHSVRLRALDDGWYTTQSRGTITPG